MPRAITVQEKHFAELMLRGLSPTIAGQHLGLSRDEALEMYKKREVAEFMNDRQRLLDVQSYKSPEKIPFTRDDATMLYLEAHRKAANSMEEIRAVDSLVKLHGLAEPEKKEITLNNSSSMREATEEELLRLSGFGPIDLQENEDGTYE